MLDYHHCYQHINRAIIKLPFIVEIAREKDGCSHFMSTTKSQVYSHRVLKAIVLL